MKYFTDEDIKKAFRAGVSSTDLYARQKGYSTDENHYLKNKSTPKDLEKLLTDLLIFVDNEYDTPLTKSIYCYLIKKFFKIYNYDKI